MFKFLKKENQPKNIKEILDYLKNLEKKVDINSEELKNLKKENKFSFQKIGIIRFNPFSSIGSDQSFSVALLDGNNNGVVITSIYAREENRVYAKPIENSQSEYPLSEEEKKAILKAVGSK